MSTTQGRTGRSRIVSAAVLLVAVAAAMLAQVAMADTASAASARPAAAAAHHAAATRVIINNNGRTYDVGTVPVSGAFVGAGRFVGGATIEIWAHPVSGGTWTRVATTKTNSAGRYSVNINATATRLYQARFAGTASWARSASPIIRLNAVRVGTRFINVTHTNANIGYNGGVDIRGIVIDARGHRVAGQRVQLWGLPQGARAWVLEANGTTNAAGGYAFSPRHQVQTIQYQVRFPATVKWTASATSPFQLTVAKLNTAVSASLLHPSVTAGTAAMVTGTVSDALGHRLAGQRVEIFSAGSSAWTHLGTAVTNAGGNYAFATRPLTASTSFQARYTATGNLNGSNSPVALESVAAPVVVTPPVVVPPVVTPPVTTPPVVTPVPAGWVSNPQLAADTLAGVNAYRAQNGLSQLIDHSALESYDGMAPVDGCVLKNTTGTICDPGNLAGGFATATEVVNAWQASPEHNSEMLVPQWGHISCAAYTNSQGLSDVGCQFDF